MSATVQKRLVSSKLLSCSLQKFPVPFRCLLSKQWQANFELTFHCRLRLGLLQGRDFAPVNPVHVEFVFSSLTIATSCEHTIIQQNLWAAATRHFPQDVTEKRRASCFCSQQQAWLFSASVSNKALFWELVSWMAIPCSRCGWGILRQHCNSSVMPLHDDQLRETKQSCFSSSRTL